MNIKSFEMRELNKFEAVQINGGGAAFHWVGKWIGRLNKVMVEACKNGYEFAGYMYY
jgi:hypothetical protein